MPSLSSRRRFIHAGCCVVGGLVAAGHRAWAVEPFQRAGAPRLLLSLAAYSFRDSLEDTHRKAAPETAKGRRIDLFQFVDYCADHGCAGAELTSYYFPKDVDDAYLIRLRRHCFLRGVDISGTAVGNVFTHPPGEKREREIASVKQWIDHAALLGAPHIRVFAGGVQPGQTPEDAKRWCVAALEECGEYAGKKGIFLGLENHGGIVADPAGLLGVIKAVQSPWIGINLDSGNFNTEDPYRDFANCAPYAVNVQMKGEVHPRGQQKQDADLKRLVQSLRDANYQGYIALEYESAEDPWKAVPVLLQRMRELFAAAPRA